MHHEVYEYISHEEVMRISERLIEQHKEALIALANAESLEDGRKYISVPYDELMEQNAEAYTRLAGS